MASAYLSKQSAEERKQLIADLYETQAGNCFICGGPIDLVLHATELDIDHIEPSSAGGKDDPQNFGLTHASCNRSKQAADLRVARVLAKFEQIRASCEIEQRGPNLADILHEFDGAKHSLGFDTTPEHVRFSFAEFGEPGVIEIPLYTDPLSKCRYFYAELPISYLHHDDVINPRNIGERISGLIKEFHQGRPQLHAALAWVDCDSGSAPVKVFDGQHKVAAQVLLGVRALPVRVFVNPDVDLLVTTNFNAGTKLKQVAFDKSVQRSYGRTLFNDRLQRYRSEQGLDDDDESMSEKDLVAFFKGESREVKKYALDAVRTAITHHPDNTLNAYVEFAGKATGKPLSYSTIEKTFLSLFIYSDVLDTPLNYRAEEGLNPRSLEIRQVVDLMNLVAEVLLADQFDMEIGTGKLENKVQKGELIPDAHLRAFRMCKEEVLNAWLRIAKQIIGLHFALSGSFFDDARLFQYPFPEALWNNLRTFLVNLRGFPMWINHDLSVTVFGGKQTQDFWRVIFETGKSPQGQLVMAHPVTIQDMIKDGTAS